MPRPNHHPRLCAIAAFCGLFGLATSASAQVSVARHTGAVWSLVTVDDVEELRDWAALTPEQEQSARELAAAARAELQAAYRRFQHQYYRLFEEGDAGILNHDQVSASQRQSEKEQDDKALTIERQLMSDLRSLMTEAQTPGWQRFERARRRLIIDKSGMSIPMDLTATVRVLGVKEKEVDGLADILDRYERDLDVPLADRLKAMEQPAVSREDPTFYDWYTKQQNQFKEIDRRADRVQARAFKAITEALPAAQREKFLRLRIRSLPAGDGYRSDIPRRFIIRDVLALPTLTPTQKDAIKSLVAAAHKDIDAAAWTYITAIDAWIMGEEEVDRHHGEDRDAYHATVMKRLLHLDDEALNVLTSQQRAAFDSGEGMDSVFNFDHVTGRGPGQEYRRVEPLKDDNDPED